MAKSKAEVATKKAMPIDGYYAVESFKDKKQYGEGVYQIGDEVSHLSHERLKYAVDLGIVVFRENDIATTEK